MKVEKYKYFTLNILGHPKSYGASSVESCDDDIQKHDL